MQKGSDELPFLFIPKLGKAGRFQQKIEALKISTLNRFGIHAEPVTFPVACNLQFLHLCLQTKTLPLPLQVLFGALGSSCLVSFR